MTKPHMYRMITPVLVGFGLIFPTACKKQTPATPTQTQIKPAELPMPASRPPEETKTPTVTDTAMDRALEKRFPGYPAEQESARNAMRQLDAKLSAEDKLAEIYRRTMVTPAPPNFKAESAARKIKLNLTLEKSTIHIGDAPRFRLDMTNVGREPITYQEYRSSLFVKNGNIGDTLTLRFYVVDNQQNRKVLLPLSSPRPSSKTQPSRKLAGPPNGLSEDEKTKWFEETNAMGQAHATFRVRLLPGETLHSIGDDDSPADNFKTILTDHDFDTPGSYGLQVELDDRPDSLSKEYIEFALRFSSLKEIHETHARRMRDALGPRTSNTVFLKVAP